MQHLPAGLSSGVARNTYVEPLEDDAAHRRNQVTLLFDEVRAEDDREAAQRGERHLLLVGQLVVGRSHPSMLATETTSARPSPYATAIGSTAKT